MKKLGISKGLRYFYGVGDLLYSFSVMFKVYYWTYFLTTVVGLPLGATGLMNTAINTFDLVMGFFWGAMIDKFKVGKWGKYSSVMIICAPLIAITHVFQWFGPTLYAFGSSVSVAVIVGFIAFALYIVFFNLAWLANRTIPTFTCANEEERSVLIGTQTIWNGVGSLTIAYVAAWMLTWFKNPVIGYATSASIMGLLTIPGYFFHCWLIKDYEWTPKELIERGIDPNTQKGGSNRVTALSTLQVLFTNGQLLITTLINIFTGLAGNIFSYMGVYLFEMILNAASLYAFYLTITNFAGIVGAFLSNILTKKIANKTLVQLSFGVAAVCLVICKMAVNALNAGLFTGLMILVRFAISLGAPSLATFYTNCAIYEEYRTGVDKTASVMGCPNISIKVSILAIGIIVPAVLASTGYVAGAEVTEATKIALANWYTLVTAAVYALAFVVVTFGYKLDRKTVDKYLKENQERRAKEEAAKA